MILFIKTNSNRKNLSKEEIHNVTIASVIVTGIIIFISFCTGYYHFTRKI